MPQASSATHYRLLVEYVEANQLTPEWKNESKVGPMGVKTNPLLSIKCVETVCNISHKVTISNTDTSFHETPSSPSFYLQVAGTLNPDTISR